MKSKQFQHLEITMWGSRRTFKRENNIEQILEIGSWEGRSSCFFLNYFKNSTLNCVDTWEGSEENFIDGKPDLNLVENNFDKNVAEYRERLIKHKSKSKNFFPIKKIVFGNCQNEILCWMK